MPLEPPSPQDRRQSTPPAPAASTPAPPPPAATPEDEVHADLDTAGRTSLAILGPVGVGKSILLASLRQAFSEEGDEFVASETLNKLIKESRKGPVPSSTKFEEYEFRFAHNQVQKSCWCVDGPGGAWFPTDELSPSLRPIRANLMARSRQAEGLVLVLDCNAGESSLHNEILDEAISILDALSVEQAVPVTLRKRRFGGLFSAPEEPATRTQKCLQAVRLVLVLNKADQLAVKRSQGFANPRQAIETIDALDYAEQILTRKFLNQLAGKLKKDNGSLAVALTSGGGFYPDGNVRLGADGMVTAPPGAAQPHDYEPYGVREALLYAAFGHRSKHSKIEIYDGGNQR